MKRQFCFAVACFCIFLIGTEGFKSARPAVASKINAHALHLRKHAGKPARQSNVAICASAAQASSVVTTSAIKAILKLIGTCGIGIYAGKTGVLDKTALSVLSKLIFNIFQPCLLFCNVAQTVATSAKGSAAVWILPLAAGLQIAVGYLVGLAVTGIIYGKKESEEKRQTLVCTTFSNSGPLPLVFVDALFRAHPDQTILPKAVAYISLYLLGWSPLFWIIAPAILSDPVSGGPQKSDAEKRKELLTRIFSPPVVGSLMGLLVGSIPSIYRLLGPAKGPFNWLFEAMRTLGTAYLPAVLLVLAGSLTPTADTADLAAEASKSPDVKKSEQAAFMTQISTIYAARFAFMPVVGFSLLAALRKYIPAAATFFGADQLLVLVLLLETCMPSAQNSTVILQLQKKNSSAARMARVLMLVYILGIPALSFWLVKVLLATNLL